MRKYIVAFIIFMITGLFLSGCEMNNEKKTNELTEHQKAWIADIDGEMREILNSVEGITENMTKEEREKRLDTLIEKIQLEKWNDDQITYYIRQMISDFGIAHMDFERSDEYCSESNKNLYPIIGKWFGDEYRIIATLPEYKESLGSKLVAIEGKDLSEILEKYDQCYSNETYSWLKSCFENNNSIGFKEMDFMYLGIKENEKNTAWFTFEKEGGNSEVEVESIDVERLMEKASQYVSIYDDMEILPFGDRVYADSNQAPFTYLLDNENRAFYFQYNECIDSSLLGTDSGYPEFASFFDDMIKTMKDKEGQYDIFIVDLRNNEGGSELLLNKAINKYKEYLRNYPIRVLIGMNTFSAGVDAIDMILYTFDDVTLYGEETGLAIHNYTEVIANELPNTGCILYTTDHADFSYVIDKRAQDLSRGVIPDEKVLLDYNEYIEGKDTIYLKAVQR